MLKSSFSLSNVMIIFYLACHMIAFGGNGGENRIARTVHNLSTKVSRPGKVRNEICSYCHTPHHGVGMRSLWGRQDSKAVYKIYESSTLDAKPDQPNGSSKMCLSCHDGTLALAGTSSGKKIGAGLMNLGTDLSDDHPISFAYNSELVSKDPKLRSPSSLSSHLKLDAKGQLQCTTCHDVHNNQFGNFLSMSDENGAMCTSCHNLPGWNTSSHSSSPARVKQLASIYPYPTVSQNSCRICHKPHNALGSDRLQLYKEEEEACLSCHNGTVAKTNIVEEIKKTSAHNPRAFLGLHDAAEPALVEDPHVECADCHNPHSVKSQASLDTIGSTMTNVRGISISGAELTKATHEYQVCLRCHSDTAVFTAGHITRSVSSTNIREEISRTAASYHPIAERIVASDTVSLKDNMTKGGLINCIDCHNNDQGPKAGGAGPNGPHGSNYPFLLERNYLVQGTVAESVTSYSLCYKCHKRESILSNESFPSHKQHIVDHQTSCATCHDPHGVVAKTGSSQTHLINFNSAVVFPLSTGELEFLDKGRFKGSCALSCHGEDHKHDTHGY